MRGTCQTFVGLDVDNGLLGNFHLSWTGTRWFSNWCKEQDLPYPFIGWVTGDNSGDQCELGPDNEHTRLAKEWCEGLEEKHPEIAKLGTVLITAQDTVDLWDYLYPHGTQGNVLPLLSEEEWNRRAVASWYAILKHGVEDGDTLAYC